MNSNINLLSNENQVEQRIDEIEVPFSLKIEEEKQIPAGYDLKSLGFSDEQEKKLLEEAQKILNEIKLKDKFGL